MLLLGKYPYQLDDRGRFRIPPKMKAALGDNVVLMRGLGDRCVLMYSAAEFESYFSKLRELSIADPKATKAGMTVFSTAENAEADGQGRVLLPAELKEYAAVKKDVVIVGMGRCAAIWDADAWSKYSEKDDDEAVRAVLKERLE